MNARHFRAYALRESIQNMLHRRHEIFHGIMAKATYTKKGDWRKKLLPLKAAVDHLNSGASRVERAITSRYERDQNT